MHLAALQLLDNHAHKVLLLLGRLLGLVLLVLGILLFKLLVNLWLALVSWVHAKLRLLLLQELRFGIDDVVLLSHFLLG